MELSEMVKEVLYLINIMEFLKIQIVLPIKIFMDKNIAKIIAENPIFKRKKKHRNQILFRQRIHGKRHHYYRIHQI